MNRFKKLVWANGSILIILILGLTPLFWFKDGYLIIPGECPIPLDPINTFKTFLYAWYPYIQSGQPNQMVAAISPWYGFWAFFSLAGFSLQSIGKLWFILVFALAGLSMHYLASTVLEKGERNVAVLVASVFYMFNAYLIVMTPLRATPLAYTVIPLMLALYIKGLRDGRKGTKYAILIGIASAGMASTVMNSPIYAIPWVVIFFYSIYHLVVEGKKGASQLLFFVPKVIAVYFLANLWWLYPYLAVALSQYGAIVEILRPTAMSSSFVEVFRLLGWWAFYESFGDGISYVPFAHYYKTPFLVVITFVVPVLAFSAAFFRSKSRYIPFFLGLGATGIFLAHGAGESLPGSIFNFMYEHIPGFLIFREPFAKFTAITAVSYAILIGFTAESVYRWLTLRGKTIKRKVKGVSHYVSAYAFVIFVIVTILASSWPLLTGDVIFGARGVATSYIKVPDYWFETGEYLNAQDEDFKILVLPSNGITSAGLPYIWGYGAQDLTPYLVHKPLITGNIGLGSWQPTFSSNRVVKSFFSKFHGDSGLSLDFKPMLQLMNVKYLLQRNDVIWEYASSGDSFFYSPEYIKSVLETQEGIRLERTFGELDIYEIDEMHFVPHIYATRGYPR